MFQKLVNPTFFIDMRPLLPTDRARALTDETLKSAFVRVMNELIDRIPGEEWAKAETCGSGLGFSHRRWPASFHGPDAP